MILSAQDNAARDALRARQGGGARYDADEAPADDLLLARRATAFFARKLNDLDDAELRGPVAGTAGWTRAHVVAAVGYDARRLALALEPLCPNNGDLPPEFHPADIPPLDLAATLPARALRYLFEHSAIHLDVRWRDLPSRHWDGTIADAGGKGLAVRDLPRRRALTLWRHAVALGNGASPCNAPAEIRTELAAESGTKELKNTSGASAHGPATEVNTAT